MADKNFGVEFRTMFKGGGSTQFKKALADIEKQLKEVESQNKQFAESLVDIDKKMLKVISTNEKLASNMQKVKPPKEATSGVEGLKQSFDNLSNAVKGFLALEVTRRVIEIGKACLKASSDMTELQNVTDQVFGDMSKEVQQFSEDMGNAMGRSTYALQKYTSDIGSIFKGLGGISEESTKKMSEDLAALAVDIGSFKNIADDRVFTAITAGIVGETEPLKRLGIVINENVMAEYALTKGIKENWESLNQATKAQLRYQKIMESTSFMQGDAARTINTYANQLKVFQANTQELSKAIGDKLVKSSNGCLGAINDLTEGLTRFFSKKSSADFVNEAIGELNDVKSLLYEYKALSESQVKNTKDRQRMHAIVEQLKATYPQEMANVNALTTNYYELSSAIDKVTNSIEKKMETAEQDYFNTQRLNKQKDTIKELEKSAKLVSGALDEITKEINTRVPELKVKFNADDFLKEIKNGTVHSLEDYIRNKFPKEAERALKQLDGGLFGGNRKSVRDINFSVITSELLTQSEILKRFNGNLKEIDSNQKLVSANSKSMYNSLSKSLNFSNEIAQQNNRKIIEESRRAEIDRAQKSGQLVTTIHDAKNKTIDVVVGNDIGLSSKETLEILKNRGFIEMFIKGVKTTFKQLNDGRIEQSTSNASNKLGYKVDSHGRYVRDEQKKIISEKDFLNELKNNLKKETPKPPVGTKGYGRGSTGGGGHGKSSSGKGGGSGKAKGKEKEKDKWEQMLDNLEKSLKDLSTPLNTKITPKIKEVAEQLRKKQDELTEWLVSVSEIKGFEATKEKIKHLEDQLKVAVELKDSNNVEKIRAEINKLKVENVLPELFGSINKELEEKIRQAQGMNMKADTKDIETTRNNIEKYKAEKMKLYKSQLENGNLSQSEYIDKQLELHKEIIEIYKKYTDKAGEIKEFIEQKQLEVQQVTDNIQQGVFIANIENAINNGSTEQLRDGIVKVYDEVLNKIQQAIIESAKNLDTKEYSEAQKLLSSKGEEFNKIAKEISETGSKQLKALLELVKNLFDLKEVRKAKNSLTTSEKALKGLDVVGQTIKSISSSMNGKGNELLNGVSKMIDTAISIFNNVQKAMQAKSSGDMFGMFGSIGGIIGSVVGVIGGIFGSIFGDNGTTRVNEEKRKAIDKYNEDIIKTNNNLRSSMDNLTQEMKTFGKTLIQSLSKNTSNENLKLSQDIVSELVRTYANSFNPNVSTTISREKLTTSWWGLSSHREYLGTETEQRRLREILHIPEFDNASDIMRWYRNNRNSSYSGNFYDPSGTRTGLFGLFGGDSFSHSLVGTNFNQVLNMLPAFANSVNALQKLSANIKSYGVLESFEGVSVTTAEDKKDQLRTMFRKLAEASGQNYLEMADKIERKLDELIKTDDVIVTAFDDVRNGITTQLAQGNNIIDGLATALQGYFNKIRNNIAKVKYDLEFRDMQGFESNFIEKFRKVSEELKKIRLENGKTLKDLNPKVLDFRDQFRQLNRISKVSTDMQNIIKELRRQAKEEGLSEEVIDKILPLGKIADKVKSISEMIKNALTVAIDTNSFDQFSMSLGDSLYKSVKESIIKAFVETTKFQELYKRYMDTEEYDKEIQKAKTMRDAYNSIQKQLKKAELMLKAEGLGFRETNASNGEYLGGLTARQSLPATSKLLSGSVGEISTTVNIYNNGYLSTDSNKFIDDMTDQIIKKIDERKKKEV
ncbi:hypothetical protein VC03_02900 [Sneathia vaginalis]|uniref:Uncharacterized protein n=1 Tax=Sneathia vaginalis TaxID=187101 RepID=A0A0E3Z9X6_9FUSO|nr:hypothetical protein [Sneathia vaginalis]AKC95482.1 hypothetical protein VC03_02900 [Sneathia vaginalis]